MSWANTVKCSHVFSVLLAMFSAASWGQHHRHGHGELTLSTDGDALLAEFRIDAETAQGGLIDRDDAYFREPGSLFTFEGSASCRRIHAHMTEKQESGSLTDPHDDDHDHDDHDKHDDHRDHDDHTDHDDDDDHQHRDVFVSVRLTCAGEPVIDAVTVTSFDLMEALETVDVTILTSRQQAEKETNRTAKVARFR